MWCRLGRVWLAQGYPVRFLTSGALNMSSSSHAGSRPTWCVSCSLGCQIGGSFVGRAVLVITLIYLIPEIHLSSQVRPRLSKHSLSFWSGTYWGLHAENARLLALIPEMPTQIFLPLAVLQAALFLCLGESGVCRAKSHFSYSDCRWQPYLSFWVKTSPVILAGATRPSVYFYFHSAFPPAFCGLHYTIQHSRVTDHPVPPYMPSPVTQSHQLCCWASLQLWDPEGCIFVCHRWTSLAIAGVCISPVNHL